MTSPHLALDTQADAGPFRAGLRPAALPPYMQHLVKNIAVPDLGWIPSAIQE